MLRELTVREIVHAESHWDKKRSPFRKQQKQLGGVGEFAVPLPPPPPIQDRDCTDATAGDDTTMTSANAQDEADDGERKSDHYGDKYSNGVVVRLRHRKFRRVEHAARVTT